MLSAEDKENSQLRQEANLSKKRGRPPKAKPPPSPSSTSTAASSKTKSVGEIQSSKVDDIPAILQYCQYKATEFYQKGECWKAFCVCAHALQYIMTDVKEELWFRIFAAECALKARELEEARIQALKAHQMAAALSNSDNDFMDLVRIDRVLSRVAHVSPAAFSLIDQMWQDDRDTALNNGQSELAIHLTLIGARMLSRYPEHLARALQEIDLAVRMSSNNPAAKVHDEFNLLIVAIFVF